MNPIEIKIELPESSIKHGRIYFPRSNDSFFPSAALSERSKAAPGVQMVKFITGKPFEFEYVTDIRKMSAVCLSPRKSFGRYLNSVNAKAGDWLRVERRTDREYFVEYLGQLPTPASDS